MPVAKDKPTADFQVISAGTIQAVCYAVWDLGIQINRFGNQEKKQHEIMIAWEVNETIRNKESEYFGKRLVTKNTYLLSLNEKSNLRKHLESWRGRVFTEEELKDGFETNKLIGVNCLLSIVHNKKGDRTHANVVNVMKSIDSKNMMTAENSPDNPPDWVKKIQAKAISKSEPENDEPDIDASKLVNESTNGDPDDEVPF